MSLESLITELTAAIKANTLAIQSAPNKTAYDPAVVASAKAGSAAVKEIKPKAKKEPPKEETKKPAGPTYEQVGKEFLAVYANGKNADIALAAIAPLSRLSEIKEGEQYEGQLAEILAKLEAAAAQPADSLV